MMTAISTRNPIKIEKTKKSTPGSTLSSRDDDDDVVLSIISSHSASSSSLGLKLHYNICIIGE